VAGTAAAGLALVPSAVTVAPQFVNVACPYPDTVTTSTSVSLAVVAAPYGASNRATVRVTSGAADPKGRVRISVQGVKTVVKTVRGGRAGVALPRTLDAQETYTVRARFLGDCEFRGSAATAYYIVNKADVNVNPTVRSARKARFAASFRGAGGLHPQGGQARFAVQRKSGKTVRAASTGVRNGRAFVDTRNLRKGKYKLVVTFRGTSNFNAGRDAVWFRVR
jgi:hypothetical protein